MTAVLAKSEAARKDQKIPGSKAVHRMIGLSKKPSRLKTGAGCWRVACTFEERGRAGRRLEAGQRR
jgi:hypothetical protein